MTFVDKEGPYHKVLKTRCWVWKPTRDDNKYGRFWLERFNWKSNRAAYHLLVGPFDKELHVLHRCDNKGCVNPDHLFLGTHRDNMDDMLSKGRQASGDRHWSRTHPEKRARGVRHGTYTHPGLRKGEKNGRAKLTEQDVVKIRGLFKTGKKNRADIARQYRVTWRLINAIIKRQLWSHVT